MVIKRDKNKNTIINIKVMSKDINLTKPIPKKFICSNQGVKNLSPEIRWKHVPDAKSYVLMFFDPDAPSGTWVHWLLTNIPAKVNKIPSLPSMPTKNIKVYNETIKQGINSWGKIGYGGPCPPPGNSHRYYLVIYALNINSNDSENSAEKFLEKIQGHVIGKGHVMGKYQRK